MTRATVPWFPALATFDDDEMPGPAVRFVHLVGGAASELGMVSLDTMVEALVYVTGCDEERALKGIALALHLGVLGAIDVTTTAGQA